MLHARLRLSAALACLLAVASPVVAAPTDTLATTFELREVGSLPRVRGELVEPSGLVEDAFGRLWVSDAALHTLSRFGLDGARLDQTGALGDAPSLFRRPGALARVGSLGIAVLDVENRRVTTWDHHLRLLGIAVEFDALESRLGRVRGVSLAADRGGALVVADADRDRLLVFDFAGAFVREIGGFGSRTGGFTGLQGVVAGTAGQWVTVERPRARGRRPSPADSTVGRARVQWLDAGGRTLASAWTPPCAAGAAETAVACAVDERSRVAVCAERSGEVFVIAADGTLLARASGLASPRALAFSADGTLWVAEAGAGRVRRFALIARGE